MLGAVAAEAAAVAAAADVVDRVGIGWRDRLAAGIFAHLGEIDVIEVLAESCDRSSTRQKRNLRALGCDLPLLLHGVGMGLASVSPVDSRRLDRIARLCGQLHPRGWSEHLAFVRSGGCEIGHLAAPPRNAATVEGALRNLHRIRRVIGSSPAVENIATLMTPPASPLDEPDWVTAIAAGADVPLLLDLHNLYVNAVNFGFDPPAYLRRFPLDRVDLVHISGGSWIETRERRPAGPVRRLLDDHRHDVPDPVFELLEILGESCPRPLDVILERDAGFPPMRSLLAEIERARRALASGRRQRVTPPARHAAAAARWASGSLPATGPCRPKIESLIARLLIDADLRREFLDDAAAIAAREQLTSEEREAMRALDRIGLEMAAGSIAAKRSSADAEPEPKQGRWRWLQTLRIS
jgi:uncharacterized protein (UPF0276 family)